MKDIASAWSRPDAVDYYATHRHTTDDLYPSEAVFLPRVLFPGIKVLDVGCASGGLFNIMRTMEPAVDYTGIDIAEPSIKIARERYPEARFEVTHGLKIPFDDGAFDLVHCTSVFVNEPRYQELMTEMYRVCNRFLLTDIRLLKDIKGAEELEQSRYRIKYEGKGDTVTVPYAICDADEVVDFMLSLDPSPNALRGTGYFHAVSEMAETPYSEVCMALFLIQKGNDQITQTELDLSGLPIDFAASHRA